MEDAPTPTPLPTRGRIVDYTLSTDDAVRMRAAEGNCNPVDAGSVRAAIVVETFGGSAVNLRVLADGDPSCDVWVTSARYDEAVTAERTWRYPARV